MAEGGGSDSDDNPFSFKNFVHTKEDSRLNTRTNGRINTSESGALNLPDVSHQCRNKQQKQNVTESSSKKSGDPNPFSFKKFLQTSSSGTGTDKKRENVNFSHNTPDFATDLPDFVQDHYSDSYNERERTLSQEKIGKFPDFGLPPDNSSYNHSSGHLPDFTLDNSRGTDSIFPDVGLPGSNLHRQTHGNNPVLLPTFTLNETDRSSSPDFQISKGVSDSVDEADSMPSLNMMTSKQSLTVLPDFLSDGIYKNSEHFSDSDFVSPSTDDDVRNGFLDSEDESSLELENRRLKQEIEQLQNQLSQTKREIIAETQRKHKMKKDMEAIQKKEAEETAALERMVQQVEANLSTTTQRAVLAETQVTKLQSEIKSLQGQVARLKAENKSLNSGDHGMADLKERTTYAAQQLASAATTAEHNLKQLLSGVENLKILSQVLESIDKFQEQKDNNKNNMNNESEGT